MTDLEREAIGKALGYALAVYDQTAGRTDELGRISETMTTLADMAADDRFPEDVADVLSGLSAGLMAFMQVAARNKARLSRGG